MRGGRVRLGLSWLGCVGCGSYFNEVNDDSKKAPIPTELNLAMARVAGIAEFWLDKPVIAINTATYWYALRQNGIDDKVHGWGSLLSHH